MSRNPLPWFMEWKPSERGATAEYRWFAKPFKRYVIALTDWRYNRCVARIKKKSQP